MLRFGTPIFRRPDVFQRGLWMLLGTLLVALLSADRTHAQHPHIVLIMVDDMGYGDPGCFNKNSKIPTANIDSLARGGMKFTDAHAPGPLCHMSRYGLMTGCYPFRTNVNLWRSQPLIRPDQQTIATLLSEAGYKTAMVGKWHLGFDEKGYDKPLHGGPVDVGFDSFFGIRASTDIPPYFYIRSRHAVMPPTEDIEARNTPGWSPIQGEFWRAGKISPDLKLHDVLPRFTEEACKVIADHDQSADQPLMLYVAFPAPHTPWLPSDEFRGTSAAGMYGDFAAMVDAMVGRILDQIDNAGMTQDTMVIFTSDNGPVWYEQDVARFDHDSSGGLRGMKADAWECGHRMPFIVRWPGKVAPGTESNKLISFCDLFATFAEIVGVDAVERPANANAGPDSFSFFGELTAAEPKTPQRQNLVLKSGRGLMTMRRGKWKFIDGKGSGGFSGRRGESENPTQPPGQLYDLDADLGETQNLYSDSAELVTSLRNEMRSVVESGASR